MILLILNKKVWTSNNKQCKGRNNQTSASFIGVSNADRTFFLQFDIITFSAHRSCDFTIALCYLGLMLVLFIKAAFGLGSFLLVLIYSCERIGLL